MKKGRKNISLISFRKVRASFRDTYLLFRQFQWPLFFFVLSILGGGYLYYRLALVAREPIDNLSEAIYHVLGLTFLNPIETFPNTWYLAVFYFLMPIVGIGILAQGIADFGILFFNRRERSKEWEMAVASTFNDHVVLIGLGHLGYRVAKDLYTMGQDVVVIELNPDSDLVTSLRELDIPLLVDDGTREIALKATNITKARTIILCTQDDSLNLQMALKARSLAPTINVVLRIFDDDFAHSLENQFGFRALSTTGTASPLFAAAAMGVDMTRPITVEGQALSLASFKVSKEANLCGKSVGDIESSYEVSVVLIRRDGEPPDFHPASNRTIHANDILAVLGVATEISGLINNHN
jgi:Trk K+ transport system NAD-binding subunit